MGPSPQRQPGPSLQVHFLHLHPHASQDVSLVSAPRRVLEYIYALGAREKLRGGGDELRGSPAMSDSGEDELCVAHANESVRLSASRPGDAVLVFV